MQQPALPTMEQPSLAAWMHERFPEQLLEEDGLSSILALENSEFLSLLDADVEQEQQQQLQVVKEQWEAQQQQQACVIQQLPGTSPFQLPAGLPALQLQQQQLLYYQAAPAGMLQSPLDAQCAAAAWQLQQQPLAVQGTDILAQQHPLPPQQQHQQPQQDAAPSAGAQVRDTSGSGDQPSGQRSGARRYRKPSDAQRAAHKRFRDRRKAQMQELERLVAAKRAQLSELTSEHEVLSDKARGLEQLVAAAGDHMAVLQGLERLSIGSRQQPQPLAPVAVTRELQALAPSLPSAADTLTGQGSPLKVLEVALRRLLLPGTAAADQLMHAFQLDGGHGTSTLQPLQLQKGQQVPAPDAQQQLQQQVASLQPLLKRLAQELAVLVMQIQEEEQQQQQQQEQQAAEPSVALQRVAQVMAQVNASWIAFSLTQRVHASHLHLLNMDTGELGVQAPPGHWQRLASFLSDKMSPDCLADLLAAYKLFSREADVLYAQRWRLLEQLQAQLQRFGELEALLKDEEDVLHCEGHELLDSIDINLRREYVLMGCISWAFYRMMPPLLDAEVLLQSWPFVPDCIEILSVLGSSSAS